jgi:hypothetical protein
LSEVTFNLTATNNGTNASCSITLKTDSAPATVTSYEISTPTFTIDYVKNSAITSSVTLTTIDSNGDTITNNLTYSIYPTLPNGITIDPNTGVISGTATD